MTKACTAWEGWEARRSHAIDFMMGEDTKPAFADFLAAESATVQRLLESCGRGQVGSAGAGRVSEDLHSELARLTEKNRELRATLDTITARVQRSKQAYQHHKEDQKLLSQEVKETYEAFLMAKKYYKKHLKLYYTLEEARDGEHTVYVQFFTERRTDNQQYSVRFTRNIKSGRSQLVEMTPMLATFKGIKNRLAETNDMPGALCCIRQSFLMIQQRKT